MNFTLIPIISQTYSLHFLISHYSLSITYPGNAHIGDYPIYIHKFNRIQVENHSPLLSYMRYQILLLFYKQPKAQRP